MIEKYQKTVGIVLIIMSFSWLFVLPFIPLKSNHTITANLLTQSHNVLVFFGYPGCRDICSQVLQRLQKIYESCANPQQLAVVFVNLWEEMSTHETQQYAQFFHKDFIGLAFSNELNQSFGAWKIPQADQQLIHSDYVYLLENKQYNQWIMKELFKSTFSEEQLLSQLQCINRRL
jgi:cytochrome oxidase Cu insertion factor (SCO1/SenC/PrrC family)